MSKNFEKAATASAALASTVISSSTAENPGLSDLLEKIQGKDEQVRTQAWQNAARIGAPAIKPLAALFTNPDLEVARAAKRGLWNIVRTVGCPGAESEKTAVVTELITLLKSDSASRREVLWMLSEIGGDECVQPIAAFLSDAGLREDARAVLIRIPGQKSIAALQAALAWAPEDFKPALAEALRDRGQKSDAYRTHKLRPTKATTVKPVG